MITKVMKSVGMGGGYISLLCEGEFDSLEEMDQFWEDYGNSFRRQEI